MPRIGPTFGQEIAAAECRPDFSIDTVTGVPLLPASWTQADVDALSRVIAAHDPTRQLPRSATAKQIRYALNTLGVRVAWNTAVSAADQEAQDYWTSADPMSEANGKIAKWCKAASITPKALFDQAATE